MAALKKSLYSHFVLFSIFNFKQIPNENKNFMNTLFIKCKFIAVASKEGSEECVCPTPLVPLPLVCEHGE